MQVAGFTAAGLQQEKFIPAVEVRGECSTVNCARDGDVGYLGNATEIEEKRYTRAEVVKLNWSHLTAQQRPAK